MANQGKLRFRSIRASQVGVVAYYIFFISYIWRSLSYAHLEEPSLLIWYAGLEALFLLLFALVMWRKMLPMPLLHACFGLQSLIIFCLVAIPPYLDYLTGFYVLLSYQVALRMPGRKTWVWSGIFIALIIICLVPGFGWIKGIALALTPIAGCIIFPIYVIANREEEQANLESEAILQDLRVKHAQLQVYTTQAEQIAAIEERNRLARELHDSVSQTIFSIMLNNRSTQILLERQPEKVRQQLEQLQLLTHDALAEMRSLIAQLRSEGEGVPSNSGETT